MNTGDVETRVPNGEIARADEQARGGVRLRRVLGMLLLFVLVYAGFAVYGDVRKIKVGLERFEWWTFGAAFALAFGNYVLRFFKWQFYLSRLSVRGVGVVDSFLTFVSGFVLTISPGKVGEVFKSLVLFETHGVPMPKTAPIVVAERITDLIGVIVLIVLGSLGFHGGFLPAAVGTALVGTLLAIIASRTASFAVIRLITKLPGPFRKLGSKLEEAYESLTILVAPRNLLVPTLLSIAAWSLECMALAVILHGFGEHVPLPLSVFFYATSTLAGAVIPTPGGLGVTETGLRSQMIEIAHIDPAASTAAMMLVRLATLWFAVVVGFAGLGILKRRYPALLGGKKKD
ncbi:MAG TPA: lysylphosphatidylglycerol synthase transmembrane domain-containing protein [Polyangiaceae bacterium]|nr:lysylphosphatidylglycerol synthase transmembrane domain-containing protein [Polyangiaceae bacterium]